MITIEHVHYPYCVAIPVAEDDAKDAEWYNRLRNWLIANVEDFKIIDTGAWVVAVGVKTEQDAILVKVAFECDTPMPTDYRLSYREHVRYEPVE